MDNQATREEDKPLGATRSAVYAAIDSERDYQDGLFDSEKMSNKTIGDWVTVLRVYIRRAEDSWMYDGDHKPLDVVRKIAAVGVHSMEQLGAVRRFPQFNTIFPPSTFIANPKRHDIYEILDEERNYQINKWKELDSRNSVGDFLTYMKELSRECDRLSNPDYPERSLNIIRKLTGVAVACMERHGAPQRLQSNHGAPLRQQPDYAKDHSAQVSEANVTNERSE